MTEAKKSEKVVPISGKKESTKIKPVFSEIEEELRRIEQDDTEEANKKIAGMTKFGVQPRTWPFLYRRGSDNRGHSVTVTVRLTPWMLGVIQEVIESRKTPFRNSSEFVRNAIFWAIYDATQTSQASDRVKRALSDWIGIEKDFWLEFKSDIEEFKSMVIGDIVPKAMRENFVKSFISKLNQIDSDTLKLHYYKAIKPIIEEAGLNTSLLMALEITHKGEED